MEKQPWWKNPLKYFLHGALFSVIFIVLAIFWVVIFALLVVVGFIIGFIIGFVVFFLILGGINVFLTDLIWGFSLKDNLMSLLSHGFVLFIALIVAHIPSMILNLVVPSLATTIVLLILNAFIDGFIAKNIGGMWEAEEDYEESTQEP